MNAAQSGSSDANHLNTTDLAANSFQLNWACYNDGADTSLTTVDGWTTGASAYIRVYTPTDPSEVGASQRHTGVAGTGYVIAPSSATSEYHNIIYIKDEYFRFEGIEIDGSSLTNSLGVRGVFVQNGLTNIGDIRVDSCIIHDLETNSGGHTWEGSCGIMDLQNDDDWGPPMTITNNVIYNIANNIASGHTAGMIVGL